MSVLSDNQGLISDHGFYCDFLARKYFDSCPEQITITSFRQIKITIELYRLILELFDMSFCWHYNVSTCLCLCLLAPA